MSVRMKPAGKIIFLILFLGVAAGTFKIYKDKHPDNNSPSQRDDAKIANVPDAKLILKIAGSNTIGDALAPALVKGYMELNGYSNVNITVTGKDEKSISGEKGGSKERIDISAHGTSTGFSSLDNNSADICMASSKATSSSYEEHVIGLDGIAVIVNSSNSLNQISLGNTKDIFAGSKNMSLYRMDDNSGTYKVFEEMVMNGGTISSNAKSFSSGNELVNGVKNDNDGIGFTSYTFINTTGIRALPISISNSSPAIVPNVLTIQSEKYPLCRRLYMYKGNSNNTVAKDFLHYVESIEGQKVVENNGFINLNININNDNDNPISLPGDPLAYTQLINNGKKIITEFRFEFGSQNLDSRAKADVDRIIQFLAKPENRGKKLILVGFTDNVGDPNKNIALSIQRAKAVQQILTVNGAEVKNVMGFGPARPVRGNDTEEDRANNRRVEIWLVN